MLNFSISRVAFSSVATCYSTYTAIAVADTDRDGRDEVFSSSGYATDFFTRLPNTTLISAASEFDENWHAMMSGSAEPERPRASKLIAKI
jgi:hypothetical protein